MESIDQGPDQFLPSLLVALIAELFLSGQEVFKYTHTHTHTCSLFKQDSPFIVYKVKGKKTVVDSVGGRANDNVLIKP